MDERCEACGVPMAIHRGSCEGPTATQMDLEGEIARLRAALSAAERERDAAIAREIELGGMVVNLRAAMVNAGEKLDEAGDWAMDRLTTTYGNDPGYLFAYKSAPELVRRKFATPDPEPTP